MKASVSLSVVSDPWIVAQQGPLSMGLSRQEYWIGVPRPPPGDLPNPGIKLASLSLLHWQVNSLPTVPPGKHQVWNIRAKKLMKERNPASSKTNKNRGRKLSLVSGP